MITDIFKQSHAKYGILYSKAGNGICHQVHLSNGSELLERPSSRFRFPYANRWGIGMLAIGAGGLDVAVAMSGGLSTLPVLTLLRQN